MQMCCENMSVKLRLHIFDDYIERLINRLKTGHAPRKMVLSFTVDYIRQVWPFWFGVCSETETVSCRLFGAFSPLNTDSLLFSLEAILKNMLATVQSYASNNNYSTVFQNGVPLY